MQTKTQFIEKKVNVIFVDHDAVRALVFNSEVYDKYPIICHAFRSDFMEGTEESTAQIMIGFVKDIVETGDGKAEATITINSRFEDKFETLENSTLQVISMFDKETGKTFITKYRLLTQQRIDEINRKRSEKRNNSRRGNFRKRQ